MRIYKPSYSKPLPEGAKTFECKQGKDKGKMLAKFRDSRGRIVQARLTKGGDKILCEVTHWHLKFKDHFGITRLLKAHTSKDATEWEAVNLRKLLNCRAGNLPLTTELAEWVEKLSPGIRDELISFGVIDAQRATIGKPLSAHVAEYTDHLAKKERGDAYVKEVAGMLTRVFTDCNFTTWTDIAAPRLKDYLDGLRDAGKGISKRRYNGLLGAVKSFARWMVRQQKATSSPVEFIDGMDNPQTDPRHPRRVLELNDFKRFIEAALMGPAIYGLSGYQRNLLYRVAVETGLRSVDIRRLRVRDFDFQGRKFTVKAGRTKNKSDATVYLKPATAIELQQYCGSKLPEAQVFHLTDKAFLMVKFDLKNAGIPYCANGEFYDFHSLRHQTASLLAMNSTTSETVRQQAMRHKTPAMTRHYSHAFEDQQREAIEALPDLTQPSKESQRAVNTGTDNVTTIFLSNSCFSSASGRTETDKDGTGNIDCVEIMQLGANNEGAVGTVDPKVEGSSPFGLAGKRRLRYRERRLPFYLKT
ncbi:MAG: tyrosine-type recombinase/integrase [Planctomycetota bacterium]